MILVSIKLVNFGFGSYKFLVPTFNKSSVFLVRDEGLKTSIFCIL